MEEVGEADAGVEKVGGVCPYLGPDILGAGSVVPVVQAGDVVYDTAHREGVGRIPPQGGPQADIEPTLEREGWSVGIPPDGGRDGGSGTAGGGYILLPPSEHGRTVHYDQAHHGPLYGGVLETGAKGIQTEVVIGRGGCGRDTYGGSGGVPDGGGGGYGRDGYGDGLNWWEDNVAIITLG